MFYLDFCFIVIYLIFYVLFLWYVINMPYNIPSQARNVKYKTNFGNGNTERHRLAEWIEKQDPYICYLQETHFRPRDIYRLKVRGWKNIFHGNGNQKKA